MGKGTKVVAHEGTNIFYKCGYGDGYYSTLPIGYTLPSLVTMLVFLSLSLSQALWHCDWPISPNSMSPNCYPYFSPSSYENKSCWGSNQVPMLPINNSLPPGHWCFWWHVFATMLCIQHKFWVLFLSISQSLNHFSSSCNWT